jgi:predicted nucleic-acid-binding protein
MGSSEAVKSVDTNVLARLILADDAVQTPIAEEIVRKGVRVSLTVLLELGWLLGSRAAKSRAEVNLALLKLLDNEAIHVEDDAQVRAALELFGQGADLADVIHLVAARGSEAFVTFDKGVPSGEDIGVEVELV